MTVVDIVIPVYNEQDDFGRQIVTFAEIGVVSTFIATAVAMLGFMRSSRPVSARSPLHGWRGDLAGRPRA